MDPIPFFALYAVLIIGGIWFVRARTRSPGEIAIVTTPPSIESLAWLRGGRSAVLCLAIFDLARLGAVRVNGQAVMRQPAAEPATGFAAELLAVLPYRATADELEQLAETNPGLTSAIAELAKPWLLRGLASDPESTREASRGAWLLGVTVGGLGLWQVITGGGMRGFTIIMGLFGVAAIALTVPVPRLTARGVREVRERQAAVGASTDLREVLALCGTTALAETAQADLALMYPPNAD